MITWMLTNLLGLRDPGEAPRARVLELDVAANFKAQPFDAWAQMAIGKARRCVEAAERTHEERLSALVEAEAQLRRAVVEVDRAHAPASLEGRMEAEIEKLHARLSKVRGSRCVRTTDEREVS